jgi:hypothetical protein
MVRRVEVDVQSRLKCSEIGQLQLKAAESMLNKFWLRRLFIELVILASGGVDIWPV